MTIRHTRLRARARRRRSAGAAAPEPARSSTPPPGPSRAAEATVSVFKGIPYAKPPVGRAAGARPSRSRRWTEVRARDRLRPGLRPAAIAQADASIRSAPMPVSEDCLSLNVWSPDAREEGAR